MSAPVVQIVTFRLDGLSEADYRERCDELTPAFRDMPGLVSKVWLADPRTTTYGGVYVWRDDGAHREYVDGPIFAALQVMPGLRDVTTRSFGVLEGPTAVTAPYIPDRPGVAG